MVALTHPGDARPDLLDDARALVAADHRIAVGATLADVLVGVTQATDHHPDEHLVLLGLVEVELGHLPLLARPSDDCCACLHGVTPSVAVAAPALTGCGAFTSRNRNVLCQVMSSS